MNVTDINNTNSVQDMCVEILRRRYFWKDNQGKVIETEDQMFHRVAKHIASAETDLPPNYMPVVIRELSTSSILYC